MDMNPSGKDLKTEWLQALLDLPAGPGARLRRLLLRLRGRLDLRDLTPTEVAMLGAYVFPEAPELILALARALRDEPDLFAGCRPGGLDFLRRQGRVLSLQRTEWVLEDLLAAVRQNRVHEQGELVRSAIRLVDRIDRDDRDFYDARTGADRLDPEARDEHLLRVRRRSALWRVLDLLQKRRSRCRPKKAGPEKAKGRKGTPAGRAQAATLLDRLLREELRDKRR